MFSIFSLICCGVCNLDRRKRGLTRVSFTEQKTPHPIRSFLSQKIITMKRRVSFLAALLFSMLIAISCGNQADNDRDRLEENDRDDQTLREENRDMEEVREFVNEATSDGIMEIRMAEIAMQKSQNPEVDQLAEHIKADHEKAGAELKSIAASKNWSVPVMMMDKHQQKVEKLMETDADKFDEEYLETMVNAHKDAIDKFEKCADKNHDPEVTMWVNNTLPVLRQHLQQSETLRDKTADAQ